MLNVQYMKGHIRNGYKINNLLRSIILSLLLEYLVFLMFFAKKSSSPALPLLLRSSSRVLKSREASWADASRAQASLARRSAQRSTARSAPSVSTTRPSVLNGAAVLMFIRGLSHQLYIYIYMCIFVMNTYDVYIYV